MQKIFLSIFILAFSLGKYFAQPMTTSTPNAMKKAAEEAEAAGNPYAALEFYDDVYDETKDKAVLAKVGMLNYELRDYKQAENNFSKLVLRDRKMEYVELKFWYALCLKANEKYGDAVEQFNNYLADGTDDKLKARAKIEIAGCELAKKATQPDNLLINNAGKTVNSPQSESSPSYSNGELFFTSLQAKKVVVLDGKEGDWFPKVLSASAKDGQFGSPNPLGEQINREGWAQGNVSISADGKTMFFTRVEMEANTMTTSKIFYSTKTSDGWGAANELVGVNGDYLAKHPAEGELFGERVLFFTANMPGGKGGDDIYYATRKSDGVYTLPVNLGEVINTAQDEVTPFYLDGKLYFSSNGRPSIGGLDVFLTEWNGTVWSSPKPLDKGINTSVDDFFYSRSTDGFTGFLVSNRPGPNNLKSKTCCDDIYSWEIERVKVNLLTTTFRFKTKKEKENPGLEGATVQVFDLTDKNPTKVDEKTNAAANNFEFALIPDRSYRVIAFRPDFQPDTISFNTVGVKKTTTVEKKITLRREKKKDEPKEEEFITIKRNEPIRLNQIYYDFDDDKILPDAEKDLQFLVDLMNKYPDMKIELSSHTDAQGKDDYNEKLSQRRAESARRWMLAKGVVADRIVPVGYGERVILNGCSNGVKCDDDQHRFNRRTEFKIIAGPTEITIEEQVKKEKPLPTDNKKAPDNKKPGTKKPGGKQNLQKWKFLLEDISENNRPATKSCGIFLVLGDTVPPKRENYFQNAEESLIQQTSEDSQPTIFEVQNDPPIPVSQVFEQKPVAAEVPETVQPVQETEENLVEIVKLLSDPAPQTSPGEDEILKEQAEKAGESQTVIFDPAGVSMKFNREIYNFGTVKENAKPETTFILTNDGLTPLEIETVSACFCMSVQESTDFIMPGKSAKLEVVFDSHDQVGAVSKDIDIIFKNVDKDGYPIIKRLRLKGRVVK